jgi:hypothetical protein
MAKRTLAFLVFSLALFITPSWAQTGPCLIEGDPNCFTFDATHTSHTYNAFGDSSSLTVQFETVLTNFDLRVTIHTPKPTDSSVFCEGPCPFAIMLDPTEFPPGTLCVTYPINSPGTCEQYDFTGNAGGPNGVPVKNTNYKGLITLTLTYLTSPGFVVHTPAFGHAPGDITTFTENILTSYSVDGPAVGPTMGGKVPGLSSVVALDEPLTDNGTDIFCAPLTLTPTNNPALQKPEIEVTLKIAGASGCGAKGIRDKAASLSVSTTDTTGNITFPALRNAEGNKFHWDNKNGLNEYDINLDGLTDGKYTVTVFASKISPQNTTFCLAGGVVTTPCP